MKKLVAIYDVTVKVVKDVAEEGIQELMTLDEENLSERIAEKTDYFIDAVDMCCGVETAWDELRSAWVEDEEGYTEHTFFED